MKPVLQTILKPPDGNCIQACVASILELRLDEVPNFAREDSWGAALNVWAAERGLAIIGVDFRPQDWSSRGHHPAVAEWSNIYWMAGGRGPRGCGHSVVYRGLDMIFDPYPQGGGLAGPPEDAIIFAPVDPALLFSKCDQCQELENRITEATKALHPPPPMVGIPSDQQEELSRGLTTGA